MTKTLVVYDAEGKIYMTMDGYDEVPEGLSAIIVEIPDEKELVGIDTSVTPHQPIFKDISKTQVELLQEQVDELTGCLMEMSEMVYA